MAQLALAGAGAVIGFVATGFNPVGASIGWALGGLAGAALFPQKGPDTAGPRINDLTVQTSTYGVGIPIAFGTVRLSGNIIWSTGIVETANRRRMGKGGGRATNTTFRYSSSWALGLCEGQVSAIRKIWFDEKLVFDSSGGSVQIEIPGLIWRWYPGSETQLPDPIIEAAVGTNNAVAHRGLAYMVFDNIPLDRVGNRIPNVTVEVVMAGGLTGTVTDVVSTSGTLVNQALGFDAAANEALALTSDGSIVATNINSLATRLVAGPGSGGVGGFLLAYGDAIWSQEGSSANSRRILRINSLTGLVTRSFGVDSSSLGSSITSVVANVGAGKPVVVQVFGAETVRNFVLLTPFQSTTTYCIDGDTMAYVWGSEAAVPPFMGGAPRSGVWVQGEQRVGKTDAHYFGLSGGVIQWWTVTISEGARGIIDPPLAGGTIGCTAVRRADITAAALGHGAGTLGFAGAQYDETDGGLILLSEVASVQRLSKITAAGAVQWSVQTAGASGGISDAPWRLRGGRIALSRASAFDVYDGRSGALLQTYASAGIGLPQYYLWDSDISGAFALTTGGPRRILVSRTASNTVTSGSIAQALCLRAGLALADINTAALTDPVLGYVNARPISARTALEPLAAAYQFDAVERDDVLVFQRRGGASVMNLLYADLVRPGEGGVIADTRPQDVELPRRLTVRHIDIDRGYEPGAQHWQRPQAPTPTMRSTLEQALDLPIVLTASDAKTIARRLLTATWRERVRYQASGTTQHLLLEPGDPVTLTLADGATVRARIVSTGFGADWTLRIEAVAEATIDYTLTALAESGQGRPPDTLPLPYMTRGFAPALPLLADGDDLAGLGLRAYLFGGGQSGVTWRGASAWRLNGTSYDFEASLPAEVAYGGVSSTVPVPASYWLWDTTTAISVRPVAGASRIVGATDLEVLNGANLGALISSTGAVELIQHGSAVVQSDGSITLSRLLRGRRGTENAGAFVGATYLLLDSAALAIVSGLATLGAQESFRFPGVLQSVQAVTTVSRQAAGRAERPYAPVNIVGSRDGSNNLTITWFRRTRIGGEWLDGTEAVPLAEASEAYQVDVMSGVTVLRTIAVTAATAAYSAANQTADGLTPGNPVTVRVYQISATVGRGTAAERTI